MKTTLGKFFRFLQSELSFDKDIIGYYLFEMQNAISLEIELRKLDKFAFMQTVEDVGRVIRKICDYSITTPLSVKVWDTNADENSDEDDSIIFAWLDTNLNDHLAFMLLAAHFFQPLEIEKRLKFFGFPIFAIAKEEHRENFENQSILVKWCSKIAPQPNF